MTDRDALEKKVAELQKQLADEREEFEWDIKAARESAEAAIKKLEKEKAELAAGGADEAMRQRALMAERKVSELVRQLETARSGPPPMPPPPPKLEPFPRRRDEDADKLRRELDTLRRQLEERERSVQRADERAREGQQARLEADRLRREIADRDRELASLREKLARAEEAGKPDEARQDGQPAAGQAELDALKAELEEKNGHLEASQSRVRELVDRASRLERDRDQALERAAEVEQERDEVADQLLAIRKRSNQLETECETLNEELARTKLVSGQMLDHSERKTARLEADQSSAAEQIAKLEAELRKARRERDETREQGSAAGQVAKLEAELKKARRERDEAREQSSAAGQVAGLEAELKKARRERDEARRERDEAAAELQQSLDRIPTEVQPAPGGWEESFAVQTTEPVDPNALARVRRQTDPARLDEVQADPFAEITQHEAAPRGSVVIDEAHDTSPGPPDEIVPQDGLPEPPVVPGELIEAGPGDAFPEADREFEPQEPGEVFAKGRTDVGEPSGEHPAVLGSEDLEPVEEEPVPARAGADAADEWFAGRPVEAARGGTQVLRRPRKRGKPAWLLALGTLFVLVVAGLVVWAAALALGWDKGGQGGPVAPADAGRLAGPDAGALEPAGPDAGALEPAAPDAGALEPAAPDAGPSEPAADQGLPEPAADQGEKERIPFKPYKPSARVKKARKAARKHITKRRYAKALKLLRPLLERGTEDPVLHLLAGQATYLSARKASGAKQRAAYLEALGLMKRAAELDPAYAEAYYEIGGLFIRLEDRKAARAALERFVELRPRGSRAEAVRKVIETLR